jgi:hypothetical protein
MARTRADWRTDRPGQTLPKREKTIASIRMLVSRKRRHYHVLNQVDSEGRHANCAAKAGRMDRSPIEIQRQWIYLSNVP